MVLSFGQSLFEKQNRSIPQELKIDVAGKENGAIQIFPVGTTRDTSSSVSFITPTAVSGEKNKGFIAHISIFNRSGAEDSFSWEIKNTTTNTVLTTGTQTAAVTGFIANSYFYSPEQVRGGDSIRFEINDGILGSTAGSVRLGYWAGRIVSVEETDILT